MLPPRKVNTPQVKHANIKIEDNFPEDGHDVVPDFIEAMTVLGTVEHEEKTLKDPIGSLLKIHPQHLKDIVRAMQACPLRKNPDASYSFIHPKIGDYFAVLAITNTPLFDDIEQENSPQKPGGPSLP